MTFAQPIWLGVGALACAVLVLLFVRAARKRRAAVQLLAAASPSVSLALHRRILRDALAILGTALAFVALARPLGGYHLEAAPTRGVDLMFAVDTSKSMRAADVRPDRLTRAKLAVADLANSFDGARLGLIAFAGDAFVQAPMTADRGVFLEALDALDTDVIPRGGTDVSSAIRAAEQAMASEPDHHKVLVLLSDGEDLAGSAVAAARDAAAHGLTIYTVGVGSEAGALIEVPDASGTPQLVRDESGTPVRSHLDERTLRAIAQVTGGAYAPLGADGRGLASLYAAARAHLPQTTATGMQRRVYAERFQIPLGAAIACLLAELVIGDRRRRARIAGGAPPAKARLGRLGASALVLGVLAAPAIASAAPVGDYNAGTASYRKGDFAGAQRQFEAALHTGDVGLQANAYYDLGNTRYRAGQATLAKQDRAATIDLWKQAVAAYDAALALAPTDADAKFNRDFVAKKLAALEAEQQQKKNDQKQQSGQQQSGQQQSGQQQSGQQQSGQQQSGQQQSGQQKSGQQQNGQQQNGKQQNGQQQSGQQQNGKQQNGQQQNGQQQNGKQQNDQQQNGQQQNGKQQSGQQQNGQQKNGQQQKQNGQQQQNGQQTDQQQNGQQKNQNGQQKNGQQKNGPQQAGQQENPQQPNQQQSPQPPSGEPATAQGSGEQSQNARPEGATDAPDAAASAGRGSAQPIGIAGNAARGSGDREPHDAAAARADAARRAAGQMTRGEAVQLLDSVEHELRPMPVRGRERGTPSHPTLKDW